MNTDYEATNVNFLDNVVDLEQRFEHMQVYGQPGDVFIRRCLAGSFCMSTLGAALWLAKTQNGINREVESDPFAQLAEMQRDTIAERIKAPEMRYEDALPKAQYFFHRLSKKQQPVMHELAYMIREGQVGEEQLAFEKKWNGLDPEAAKVKLTKRNASLNAWYDKDITNAAVAILTPPKQSAEPFFSEADWYYILGKVRDYLIGKEPGKGIINGLKNDRRLQIPRLVAEVDGDIMLAKQILKYVEDQLERQETRVETMARELAGADVVPEDNYEPFDATHPAAH